MKADFDVIVIGSGPAGISAAFPMVEAGHKVMMVDGGRHATTPPPDKPFQTFRTEGDDQHKWMIGDDFHALKNRDAVSPKLRIPTHKYAFEGFSEENQLETDGFAAIGSMATGGLSNTWGCGVAKLTKIEMADYPFSYETLHDSYEVVSKRIGISGGHDDDLSDSLGLDEWSMPHIQIDSLHKRLINKYAQRNKAKNNGFCMGYSRVAALSQPMADRSACDQCGNCLLGCEKKALYSSSHELISLKKYDNFFHSPGFIVDKIEFQSRVWQVIEKNGATISARKIVLAAGTLASTRLVLRATRETKPVRLLSCPIAAFLLWMPAMLGNDRESTFGMPQLSFTQSLDDNISGFGSTFSTSGIPVSEFLRYLPLRRRFGVDLLKNLLSSCLVGNFFLPGNFCQAEIVLGSKNSMKITGGYDPAVTPLMAQAEKSLRKSYWSLGAILLPMSFTIGQPGGDIHYAGTLPMSKSPTSNQTDSFGQPFGLNGIHVVDGAILPNLPGKSHTLTIMANANRIGQRIARLLMESL